MDHIFEFQPEVSGSYGVTLSLIITEVRDSGRFQTFFARIEAALEPHSSLGRMGFLGNRSPGTKEIQERERTFGA
jgi:hypothetical protein